MRTGPNIIKSIFTSILAIVVFSLTYFLTFLLAGGIVYVLSIIPLVNILVDWIFYIRGDSPDMMLAILSPIVAYHTTKTVVSKVGKDTPTIDLALTLLGVYILAIHVPSLIINLVNDNWFFPNVTQSIAGLAYFINGATSLRKAKENSPSANETIL